MSDIESFYRQALASEPVDFSYKSEDEVISGPAMAREWTAEEYAESTGTILIEGEHFDEVPEYDIAQSELDLQERVSESASRDFVLEDYVESDPNELSPLESFIEGRKK